MADLNALKLSFRAYLRQRSKALYARKHLRLWFTTMILPRSIRETNWTNISRFAKLDRTEGYSLTPYGIAT